MATLVAYDSSDDEGDENGRKQELKASTDSKSAEALLSRNHGELQNSSQHIQTGLKSPENLSRTNGSSDTNQAANGPSTVGIRSDGVIIGPSAGPNMQPAEPTDSAPQSPYSSTRAIIHNLTLPPIPNLNIPESPPGSPPPGLDKKFRYFLELKQQGLHFNEKLAKSSALKNPSLLKKLMDAAGLEEHEQYETTLPNALWNPAGFPPWAYKEELAKSQQEVLKQQEAEQARIQREGIEFVSASASGRSSRAATPAQGTSGKGLRGSAAERVIAGLDKDLGRRSPQISNLTSRGNPGSRFGKQVYAERRPQDRSRSPGRRKRSRSR